MTLLSPYPVLKDSGMPWLGLVPEHWRIERFKSSIKNVIEPGAGREEGDLYVALEHVEGWTGRLRATGAEVSFDSQVKRFRAGDVLFGKLRPYLAKVTRPTSAGVCVGEFLVLRSRSAEVTAPYIEQLLRSKPVIDAINSSTFGAKMPRADWQFIGGMTVALPSNPEQVAIARFLDYVDRRIRRYIGAKQKLIKLLEEQKQAIIHRAVTRGLDPDVRLKPSGVEWLGDVPEHWSTQPLKRICRFEYGESLPTDVRQEGPVPVFGSNGRVGLHSESNTRAPVIVIGRKGSFGKVNYSADPAFAIDTAYFIDERHTATDIRWLSYVLGWLQLDQVSKDSAVPGLAREDAYQRLVVVPPRAEQAAIVRFLDAEVASLDAAGARAYREIALLREYRTRLIADVVTGKLDVREAAARLPDEAEEPKPLDEADALTATEDAASDDLDAVLEEAEA